MLNQLCTALDALEDMTDKHQFVSLKTQSLHDACEKLVEEQVHTFLYYIHVPRHFDFYIPEFHTEGIGCRDQDVYMYPFN